MPPIKLVMTGGWFFYFNVTHIIRHANLYILVGKNNIVDGLYLSMVELHGDGIGQTLTPQNTNRTKYIPSLPSLQECLPPI